MIGAMTDGGDAQAALAQAVAAREERARLQQRLDGARRHLDEAVRRVTEQRGALQDESEDVAKLESFSWTRIWATLKGSHASDLEREQAERDLARYAVAEAEARRDAAAREVAAVEAQVRALGDVDARYAAALQAKRAWVGDHDPATAQRLAEIAERRGGLMARDREAREAHAAGVEARDLLAQAGQLLGNARSWSTWDTFGGGGLLTDMVKYDRLDKVTALVRRADLALGRFSRELADVGMAGVGGVRVDGITRAFDIWFDNIFTDMAVRSRIQDAQARVAAALDAVGPALGRLADEGHAIAAEIARLDEERERLLLG